MIKQVGDLKRKILRHPALQPSLRYSDRVAVFSAIWRGSVDPPALCPQEQNASGVQTETGLEETSSWAAD